VCIDVNQRFSFVLMLGKVPEIILYMFCVGRRFTKPQTFADCIGNELPLGWEEAYDPQIGSYYINHVNREYIVILVFCRTVIDLCRTVAY
jgi:hypothetical protein